MDNFYSKVTRTCIKETWKMITTTQIEDLLERNWNITSLVRNHISFMNPPRRNVSSFRTNGMQAYIIQYTILMMIQCYIFYNVSYLSFIPFYLHLRAHDSARTMDRRSGWSPPAVGSRCHESCQILASLCPLIWHNTCWHGSYN